MSKDPAFLFYPGDASEDTQFMNRLERGAYFDLMKCQRIFHGFTVAQIQKVLGHDFEAVRDALFSVLKKDGETFYIQWVRDSISRRDLYSKKQSERANNRWKKENSHGNATAMPLIENEIENENIIENRKLFFKKEAEEKFSNENKAMVDEFVAYWTESSPNGLKMRCEMEKVFDINRRFATWKSNNSKYKNGAIIEPQKTKDSIFSMKGEELLAECRRRIKAGEKIPQLINQAIFKSFTPKEEWASVSNRDLPDVVKQYLLQS